MKLHYAIIGFVLLCILGSCSIEKRLYNKGYSVSRNKKFRAASNNQTVSAATAEREPHIPDNSVKPAEFVFLPETENHQVNTSAPATIGSTLSRPSPKKTITLNKNPETKTLVFKAKKNIKKQLVRKERTNTAKGVILLIYALIFALLGLVFVTNFGAFGIVFGIIFYTGAAIMLIASIVYFIL